MYPIFVLTNSIPSTPLKEKLETWFCVLFCRLQRPIAFILDRRIPCEGTHRHTPHSEEKRTHHFYFFFYYSFLGSFRRWKKDDGCCFFLLVCVYDFELCSPFKCDHNSNKWIENVSVVFGLSVYIFLGLVVLVWLAVQKRASGRERM